MKDKQDFPKKRKQWSPEEDAAITAIVSAALSNSWTDVSHLLRREQPLRGRTTKQCRERWHNHLDPQVHKDAWTQGEEVKMFELHAVHGNSWSEISKHLPGRTDNSVKNHFYSSLRKSQRRFNQDGSEQVGEAAPKDPAGAKELLEPRFRQDNCDSEGTTHSYRESDLLHEEANLLLYLLQGSVRSRESVVVPHSYVRFNSGHN